MIWYAALFGIIFLMVYNLLSSQHRSRQDNITGTTRMRRKWRKPGEEQRD